MTFDYTAVRGSSYVQRLDKPILFPTVDSSIPANKWSKDGKDYVTRKWNLYVEHPETKQKLSYVVETNVPLKAGGKAWRDKYGADNTEFMIDLPEEGSPELKQFTEMEMGLRKVVLLIAKHSGISTLMRPEGQKVENWDMMRLIKENKGFFLTKGRMKMDPTDPTRSTPLVPEQFYPPSLLCKVECLPDGRPNPTKVALRDENGQVLGKEETANSKVVRAFIHLQRICIVSDTIRLDKVLKNVTFESKNIVRPDDLFDDMPQADLTSNLVQNTSVSMAAASSSAPAPAPAVPSVLPHGAQSALASAAQQMGSAPASSASAAITSKAGDKRKPSGGGDAGSAGKRRKAHA